jgi:hypothetical protein
MQYVENPMIKYREEEPQTVAHCCKCNEALTEQDTFLDFQGEYFCDDDCFFEYHDVKVTEGWELK